MEDSFREITGDTNLLHGDNAFVVEVGNGKFRGHVSFGMLIVSFCFILVRGYLLRKCCLIIELSKYFNKKENTTMTRKKHMKE